LSYGESLRASCAARTLRECRPGRSEPAGAGGQFNCFVQGPGRRVEISRASVTGRIKADHRYTRIRRRRRRSNMKKLTITLLLLISAILNASAARAQAKYPPISEYLMPQDAEIVLARSAAPASISDHATIDRKSVV